MKYIKILDESLNRAIAKHPERNYPSLLLQGDTLKCIFDEVEDALSALSEGDHSEAHDIIATLKNRFAELILYYENTLREYNYEIPYINHLSNKHGKEK